MCTCDPEKGPLIGQNLNPINPKSDQQQFSPNNNDTSSKENVTLSTSFSRKCKEINIENLHADIGVLNKGFMN